MIYYFIYTNIGYAPRPADKFDWGTMRSVAPSGSYETDTSNVHKVGTLLNNLDLIRSVVVQIDNEAEAVAFKMVQDTFIYHTKNKPKLDCVLVDVDWKAVFAEGTNIKAMVDAQNNRKDSQQNVTKMARLFEKFYDAAIGNTAALGQEHNDELTAYSQKLDQIVEQYRSNNKSETAKLTKERAKMKKKLLSYSFK
jgi:hypothetical protein